ncbi:LacI family DNA-binding transcriptional regulator [Enterococcus sp.]|uniref:LacI family DNA-binding transcriptional regulator n=1 Tax=Enterococcus sp. TaxID=35783 RepID=UPI002FCA547B
MATIHDVAKKSGYSVSTVSRVLNSKNHVSDSARQQIEAAIQALDYVPNEIARDLSHGKNNTIGVILPHTQHPYFTEILNGVIDKAFATRYRVVILPSEYDETIEVEYLEQLRRKAFDAIIFTSRGISLEKLAEYTKYGPIVCCENPQRSDLLAVYSNRRPAYIEAFLWLKNQGITNITILLSREYESSATSQVVLDTYFEVFDAYPESSKIISGVTTYEDGVRVGKERLVNDESIECIFANVDNVAAGVRSVYLKNGQKVPLLLGQENQLSGQLLNISTIDHHLKAIGHRCFDVATQTTDQKQFAFQSKFILRE